MWANGYMFSVRQVGFAHARSIMLSILLIERERVHLVIQPAIHIAHVCATGKCKAGSLKVQRSHILSKLASNSENACSLSTTDHPCTWTVSTHDRACGFLATASGVAPACPQCLVCVDTANCIV